jgi:hypothetical protein
MMGMRDQALLIIQKPIIQLCNYPDQNSGMITKNFNDITDSGLYTAIRDLLLQRSFMNEKMT